MATLLAIQDYNKNLPKKRKVKDAIGEVVTQNIQATYSLVTDHKKGTKEVVTKYHMMGIEDGKKGLRPFSGNPTMHNDNMANRYSLAAKQATI